MKIFVNSIWNSKTISKESKFNFNRQDRSYKLQKYQNSTLINKFPDWMTSYQVSKTNLKNQKE